MKASEVKIRTYMYDVTFLNKIIICCNLNQNPCYDQIINYF